MGFNFYQVTNRSNGQISKQISERVYTTTYNKRELCEVVNQISKQDCNSGCYFDNNPSNIVLQRIPVNLTTSNSLVG